MPLPKVLEPHGEEERYSEDAAGECEGAQLRVVRSHPPMHRIGANAGGALVHQLAKRALPVRPIGPNNRRRMQDVAMGCEGTKERRVAGRGVAMPCRWEVTDPGTGQSFTHKDADEYIGVWMRHLSKWIRP